MGEGSRIGPAAMKSVGIEAVVAPTDTKESHEYARKHVVTEACKPTKGVVGDMITELYRMKARGEDPNEKAAILLPSAEGPCRFGQYRVVLRQFLDKEGFDKVAIISPMSVNDYQDIPVSKRERNILTNAYYSGMYAFDILYDALLRTRPYEKEKGSAEKAFNSCLERVLKAVETGDARKVAHVMKENAEEFKKVEIDDSERKPVVLYAGEIYMRWHDEFTQHSVKKLEENGLEVIRQPLTEWVNYINRTHIRRYMKQKDIVNLLKVGAKRMKINYIESKIRKPFAELLKGREFHNPMDFIDGVQGNELYHIDIEGESPLSIGTVYELMHGFETRNNVRISGMFHVGPWMCMQETTATAKINSMKTNYGGDNIVPVLHASFGDTANTNLDAEIAVFREQCYARRDQIIELDKRKDEMNKQKEAFAAAYVIHAA